MSKRRSETMQIGQVSKRAGVSIDAIRFYERNGLLEAPPRSEGGFRLYSAGDLSTLRFIRHLQSLGFTLNQVRDFLALRINDLRACSGVQRMLGHKLRDVRAKRIAFLKLEMQLQSALRKCNAQLSRSRGRQGGRCPVLTVFRDSEPEGVV